MLHRLPLRDLILLLLFRPKLLWRYYGIYLAERERFIHSIINGMLFNSTAKNPLSISPESIVDSISSKIPLVELERTLTSVTIGVRTEHFFTALKMICDITGCSIFYTDTRKECSTLTTKYQTIFAVQYLRFPFLNEKGAQCFVQLEKYSWVENFRWMSTNTLNSKLRAIYSKEVFSLNTLTKISDLLPYPSIDEHNHTTDAVLTWVDHQDPNWQQLYLEHRDCIGDATSMARFHNKDELKYALRGINTYAPWVNKIYIVSNCSRPEWLNLSDKICWIEHNSIMPPEFLPTFNSHVIESFLHRISGLSENFIYLNDDVFLVSASTKAGYVLRSGASICFLESYGVVSEMPAEEHPDYLNAARNSAELIARRYGFYPTRLHKHVPFSLRKSVLAEIEACFSSEVNSFRSNKFRGLNDLNITSFLYHHYALAKGLAVEGRSRSILVKANDVRSHDQLSRWDVDVVCINDGAGEPPLPGWAHKLRTYLQSRLPVAASWEKN